jgi:hypothetical protein
LYRAPSENINEFLKRLGTILKSLYSHYNKCCKTLSRVIKETKRQHYCRLIEKADNKIKTAWNIIKHDSGKLQ